MVWPCSKTLAVIPLSNSRPGITLPQWLNYLDVFEDLMSLISQMKGLAEPTNAACKGPSCCCASSVHRCRQ